MPVNNGGIGLVMNANKQVIMASGPFYRDINISTEPALTADQARAAAEANLQQFRANIPAAAANLLQAGTAASDRSGSSDR